MVPCHSHNLYEQNSHVICELGLSVINHLTQKEPDLQRTNHACTSCLQGFTNRLKKVIFGSLSCLALVKSNCG
ncbi:unnamed protein product [Brassica rapa subsp. narinosa]